MAKSVIERCDNVVGQKEGADYFTAVGSYKAGSGDTEEVRYVLGAYLTIPSKFKTGDADVDKALLLWCKRMTSADNAGLPAKIKAGDMTADEAAAIILGYNGEEFLVRLNETKVREGGGGKTDSFEAMAIKRLAKAIQTSFEAGKIGNAKTPIVGLDSPPKTEKGKVNWIAWAKLNKEHPWYAVAYKQVTSEKGFE